MQHCLHRRATLQCMRCHPLCTRLIAYSTQSLLHGAPHHTIHGCLENVIEATSSGIRSDCRGYNTKHEQSQARHVQGLLTINLKQFAELLRWGMVMGVSHLIFRLKGPVACTQRSKPACLSCSCCLKVPCDAMCCVYDGDVTIVVQDVSDSWDPAIAGG